MAIPKRKSLAGTCGIPREPGRVYVKTFDEDGLEQTYLPGDVPKRISAPCLGAWDVQTSSSRREFGRKIFGNLCVHVRVTVRGRQRDLWWEHGDWFVSKGTCLLYRLTRGLGIRKANQMTE